MSKFKKVTVLLRLAIIFSFVPLLFLQLGSFTQNQAFAGEPTVPTETVSASSNSSVFVNPRGIPQVSNTERSVEDQQTLNYVFISIGFIGLFSIVPITLYVLDKKRRNKINLS